MICLLMKDSNLYIMHTDFPFVKLINPQISRGAKICERGQIPTCTCLERNPVCDQITLVVLSNFEQLLTFKHLLFSQFAQEANEMWYTGRTVNSPPLHQIQFASYIKWWNSKVMPPCDDEIHNCTYPQHIDCSYT